MIKKYYIFGAHPRGRTFYEYMRTLEPQMKVLGFLYDNEEDNPEAIDGVEVVRLDHPLVRDKIDLAAKVYVATRGINYEKIKSRLEAVGFRDIEFVSPELDMSLRNRYVEGKFREKGKEYIKIGVGDNSYREVSSRKEDYISKVGASGNKGNACIFIARIPQDNDFEKPVTLRDYERIIQVGCELTDIKMGDASFYDNDGENISDRNSQFSEMTGLYWIWKHAEFDFAGLEHWRRRFILPDNWVEVMEREGIDVILPVPLCVMPSLEENYKGRHLPYIWDEVLKIMKEIHPGDYDRALSYFKENSLYSPCNMLIARKDTLDAYCKWVFPMLIELNDRIGTVEDVYQTRYPGFVSERMLTYFFDVNGDKYRVAYADKSFFT